MEMDSQRLLGNVVDSLRVRTKNQHDAGSSAAGVKTGLPSSSSSVLDEVRAELGGGEGFRGFFLTQSRGVCNWCVFVLCVSGGGGVPCWYRSR